MRPLWKNLTFGLALTLAAASHGQLADVDVRLDQPSGTLGPSLLLDQDRLGLPGLRPRLMMSLPLERSVSEADRDRMFSWSLEAWQLNTASLAHIQCNRLTPTIDSFLAEDCRFVDEPVPEGSINLMRVGGQWTAASGLGFDIGAFSARSEGGHTPVMAHQDAGLFSLADRMPAAQAVEGLDAGVSFGIAHDRVGEFLVGLQVARYRQRMSLLDFGMAGNDPYGLSGGDFQHYANSAQLAVGWRRGSFRGDLVGQTREVPLWLGSGQYRQGMLNSFDLEFSWRAIRNASITIGVSNVLDAAPRSGDEATLEPGLEDPMEHIYGRIPYVRYKHDL